MPTGYTAKLCESGQTFEQFVWTCARAFGAMIMMRDDALGTPIDINALCTPSPFYAEQVAKDEARLNHLKSMTREEILELRRSRLLDDIERYKTYEQERAQTDGRLDEMIAAVEAWQPPSLNHERFKEFMLEQLRMSLGGDYWSKEVDRATQALQGLTGYDTDEMIRQAEARLERSLKELADEEQRQVNRREWLTQLMASVPCPFSEDDPF